MKRGALLSSDEEDTNEYTVETVEKTAYTHDLRELTMLDEAT